MTHELNYTTREELIKLFTMPMVIGYARTIKLTKQEAGYVVEAIEETIAADNQPEAAAAAALQLIEQIDEENGTTVIMQNLFHNNYREMISNQVEGTRVHRAVLAIANSAAFLPCCDECAEKLRRMSR